MKYTLALSALFATALAMPAVQGGGKKKDGKTCDSHETVVCSGMGNGGLLSLGNILPGLAGENCSGGDVYCCSEEDVNQVCRDPVFGGIQKLIRVF